MRVIFMVLVLGGLSGCAWGLPVPGGDDKINEGFYSSEQELKDIAVQLRPGMTEQQVFMILGRTNDQLLRMDKDEIVSTLYGGGNAAFQGTLQEREYARQWLETLYGYKLHFKVVKSKHGFSSPIRLKTREEGFSYTLKLIFWQGRLFDRPILAGGPVEETSSSTIFDYLNPLSWIGRPF